VTNSHHGDESGYKKKHRNTRHKQYKRMG
jgi:hypothetical protein